jgi:hypothetical protein
MKMEKNTSPPYLHLQDAVKVIHGEKPSSEQDNTNNSTKRLSVRKQKLLTPLQIPLKTVHSACQEISAPTPTNSTTTTEDAVRASSKAL